MPLAGSESGAGESDVRSATGTRLRLAMLCLALAARPGHWDCQHAGREIRPSRGVTTT